MEEKQLWHATLEDPGLGTNKAIGSDLTVAKSKRPSLLVLVMIFTLIATSAVGGMVLLKQKSAKKSTNETSANVVPQELDAGVLYGESGQIKLNNNDRVVINGQLQATGGLVLSPGTQPEESEAGTLYVDQTTGRLRYFNGISYQDVAVDSDNICTQDGDNCNYTTINEARLIIQFMLGTLPPGLSLPQELSITSSPIFAGLTVTNSVATGTLSVTGDAAISGNLKIGNTTISTGSSSAISFILPSVDGTASQCLTTDGAGQLSFSSCSTGSGTAFVQGGNTFGATATLGTNDANPLVFRTNGVTQATLAVGGALTLQNSIDSSTAFQVQNAAGADIMTVDTINSALTIRSGPTEVVLDPANLVTSQNFTDSTYWTNCNGGAGGWSGTTTSTTHNTGNSEICQSTPANFTVTPGTTYLVSYMISGSTATPLFDDGVYVNMGGGELYMFPVWVDGTYRKVIKAETSDPLTFSPTGNSYYGTIYNVSVQILTPANAPLSIVDEDDDVTLEVRSSYVSANLFIGTDSGLANTTGSSNTALGLVALMSNTTGSSNTALGPMALGSNTTGSSNTALGPMALGSNTTGEYNTALGSTALTFNTTGSSNTALGPMALVLNTTGSNNLALGPGALFYNTTGFDNTVMGYDAFGSNTTGSGNIALGSRAGAFLQDGTSLNQTSSGSIYLGYSTKAYAAGDINEIVIGLSATGNGSNTVTLGNSSITSTYLKGTLYVDNGDTNLYRSAANTLKTDDSLVVGSNLTVQGSSIDFSSGVKTVSLNAAVDSLNFDSNTLSIDASNNRIGIGNAAPTVALDVTGGAHLTTTLDVDGYSAFGNSATLNSIEALQVTHAFGSSTNCVVGCYGVFTDVAANNPTNPNLLSAYYAKVSNSHASAALTSAAGLYVASAASSGGAITANYGISIQNQTAGTSDYGLYIAGADTYALWVDAGTSRFDGNVVPGSASSVDLGSSSLEFDELYIGDNNGVVLGLDQDATLAYDETTDDRVELTGSGASLFIEDRLALGALTATLTDDGTANDSITPASSYYRIDADETANASVPDLTISESGAKDGQLLTIINYEGDGSHDTFTISNSAGVVHLPGAATLTLGPYDSVTFMYVSDRWVTLSNSDN